MLESPVTSFQFAVLYMDENGKLAIVLGGASDNLSQLNVLDSTNFDSSSAGFSGETSSVISSVSRDAASEVGGDRKSDGGRTTVTRDVPLEDTQDKNILRDSEAGDNALDIASEVLNTKETERGQEHLDRIKVWEAEVSRLRAHNKELEESSQLAHTLAVCALLLIVSAVCAPLLVTSL